MSAAAGDPLLPKPVPPSQRSNTVFWGLASLATFVGTGGSGTRAVMNFMASRKIDGGVFSLTTVLCAGACCYCIYRVVISLKSRNIEPISPSATEVTLRSHEQMLNKIDSRLKEILPDEEVEDVELGQRNKTLYDSINHNLHRLEILLPEVTQQLIQFKQELQLHALAKTHVKSPDPEAQRAVSFSPSPAPASPAAAGDTFEADLFNKLDRLLIKVDKDKSSRSASAASSAASSPYKAPLPDVQELETAQGSGASKKGEGEKRTSFSGRLNDSINGDLAPAAASPAGDKNV